MVRTKSGKLATFRTRLSSLTASAKSDLRSAQKSLFDRARRSGLSRTRSLRYVRENARIYNVPFVLKKR